MASNTITLQVGGALELILRQPPAEDEITTIVSVTFESFTATAKANHMAYTLANDHFITVSIAYEDAAGNPAKIDGDPAWASSDDTILTVDVDATNHFEASVTPVGLAGTAQVTVTADVDLGTGVKELITLFDVTVVAGEAVAGTIQPVGEPFPKP